MSNINDLFAAVTQSLGENTMTLSNDYAKKQALTAENAQLASGAIESALGVSAQKMQGQLQAQDNSIAVRQALGNDIQDPNSLLATLVQDFRESTEAAQNQRRKVAAMSQVGLFDNPLQFISNQIQLPDEQNALAATQDVANAAAQGIQAMQSLTTQSAQAQQATAETLTADSIAQAAEVQRAELTMKINDIKATELGVHIDAIKVTEAANTQLLSMGMQMEHLRLAEAAAARDEARLKLAKEKPPKEVDDFDMYVKYYNLGARSLGLPDIDAESLKARVKFGNPKEKERIAKIYAAGTDVAMTGTTNIGTSPGEAILTTIEVGGLKQDQNKPTREFLTNIARTAAQRLGVTGKNEAEQKAIAAEVNTILFGKRNEKGQLQKGTSLLTRLAQNMESPDNIYKAPDLQQMITVPAVRNNILYESVLKPAAAAQVRDMSPDRLLAMSNEAVTRGVITREQMAKGVAEYYQSANAITYAQKGLGKFNLPMYQTYIAEVPSSTPFAVKEYWDFANEASVLSYQLRLENRNRLMDIGVNTQNVR